MKAHLYPVTPVRNMPLQDDELSHSATQHAKFFGVWTGLITRAMLRKKTKVTNCSIQLLIFTKIYKKFTSIDKRKNNETKV